MRTGPRVVPALAGAALLTAALAGQPAATNLAVVQFSDVADVPQQVLEQAHARVTRTLPRSGAQVIEFDADGLRRLQQLADAGIVRHLELANQNAGAAAIPEGSVSVNSLDPAAQKQVLDITGRLIGDDFRVSESRPVSLTADLIDAAGGAAQQVSISLLGGRSVSLTAKGPVGRRSRDEFTWTGATPDGDTTATLVVSSQGITGLVRTAEDTFSILPLAGGRQIVVKAPRTTETPEHPPDLPSGAPPRDDEMGPAAAFDTPACTSDGLEADVFVGYTAAAEASAAGIATQIQLYVDLTRQTLADSRTGATVRLVGSARWAYRETGLLEEDLRALKRLPEARAARETSRADMVVMLVAGGDACGLAGAIRARSEDAFAVVALKPDCGQWRLSFTHEIGHLYGSRHDTRADPLTDPFRDGHGFAQRTARDVMATDGSCNGCPRHWYFSNPDVIVFNQPLGDPACCNNARVIREETGRDVPTFRCRS